MKRFIKITAWLLLPCLMMAGCGGTSIDGDRDNDSTNHEMKQEASLPTPKPHFELKPLRIWFDDSGSMNYKLFANYVDEIVNRIWGYRTRISGVEVIYFSHGNRSIEEETTEKFLWGTSGESTFQPDLSKMPPEARVFIEEKKKFIEEQLKSFDEKNEPAKAEYETLVEKELKRLKDYLSHRSAVSAPCTRFSALGTRMATENLPHNLVISDGLADCLDEAGKTLSPIKLGGEIVVIQLTTGVNSGNTGDDISKRKRFLEGLFASTKVFPVYMSNQAIAELFQDPEN